MEISEIIDKQVRNRGLNSALTFEREIVEEMLREYAKAQANEAMKDIEANCEIYQAKNGDKFNGISWAAASRIMQKYGYEQEIPF